jgi:hypothetical protein
VHNLEIATIAQRFPAGPKSFSDLRNRGQGQRAACGERCSCAHPPRKLAKYLKRKMVDDEKKFVRLCAISL